MLRHSLACGALVGAAIVAVLLAIITPQAGRIANAATIDGAVLDIRVSPQNALPFSLIRTTIDWCVPDGTAPGDTFTIRLPEQLGDFSPAFELRAPAGEIVANATIGGDPATATITMSDYVATRRSVCGDAFFESRLNSRDHANTTQTLTYVINGGQTIERDVQVGASFVPTRDFSFKRGEFDDPDDQCRTSTTDCIDWVLASRSGPFESVTFTDVAADGLTFNCSELLVTYWSLNPDGSRNDAFSPGSVGATVVVDCGASTVSVVTGPLPAGTIARVRVPATPDEAAPAGGVVYLNTASIAHTAADGSSAVDSVSADRRSSAAGGTGLGLGIDIEKRDADGNDADQPSAPVELIDDSVDLTFTIENTGDVLTDVVVTDVVTAGTASVGDLTCDFSMAVDGAPTSGTTWAGPFPPSTSFECSARLTELEPNVEHADTATVSAQGAVSGETVDDSDPYHAVRVTPTTTTSTTTTPPTTTTTTTTAPPTTTTRPATTTTTTVQPQTSVAQAAATSTVGPRPVPLPATGGDPPGIDAVPETPGVDALPETPGVDAQGNDLRIVTGGAVSGKLALATLALAIGTLALVVARRRPVAET